MHSKTPYDVGISGFKRLLKENTNLTRAEKNKAIKIYKQRVKERLLEVVQAYNDEVKKKTDGKQ